MTNKKLKSIEKDDIFLMGSIIKVIDIKSIHYNKIGFVAAQNDTLVWVTFDNATLYNFGILDLQKMKNGNMKLFRFVKGESMITAKDLAKLTKEVKKMTKR